MSRLTPMGGRCWLALELALAAGMCVAAGPASQPAPPASPDHAGAAVAGPKAPAAQGGYVVNGPASGIDFSQLQATKVRVLAQHELATFKNVDEFLHPTLEKGSIKVDCRSLRGFNGEGRLKVESSPAGAAKPTWVVNVQRTGRAAWSPQVTLSRYDWDQTAEGQSWALIFYATDSWLMMQTIGIGTNVCYRQMSQPNVGGTVFVQVTSSRPGAMQPIFVGQAASLVALKQAYPNEVRQYLQPLLARLMGKDVLRPGPVELYRVFADIAADAKVTQAAKDLLPQLDADAFEKRQAASEELAKLGRPGLLAVLRMDMTTLSQEQKARLRAFINAYRQNDSDDDLDQKPREADFLLGAMEDEDVAVRTAAKSQLQSILGHAVNFDVLAVDDEARYQAMSQLHQDVAKELADKKPTTKSSKADDAAKPDVVPAGVNQVPVARDRLATQ